MANVVEVVLQAKDQASAVIDKTTASVKRLDNASSSAASSVNDSLDPFDALRKELASIGPSADVAGEALDSTAGSARLLSLALNPVVLGITAVVAALGGYVKLLFEGEKENFEFAKAVTLSGNAAGVTAGELKILSRQVGDAVGGMSGAAEVLTALAGGGRVAGDDLAYLSTVALQLERTVGIPVGVTADAFERLGKDPLKASQQLNEQYGYLSRSVEEQIKKLMELGDYSEAASVAQKAFADAQKQNLDALTGQLGTFQRVVLSVRDAWVSFKNVVLDVGRQALPEERLTELQQARGSRALFSGTSRQSASVFREADLEEVRLTQEVLQAQQDAYDKALVTRANKERAADEKRLEEARKRQDQWQKVQDSLQEVVVTAKSPGITNPWIELISDQQDQANAINASLQGMVNNFGSFADSVFNEAYRAQQSGSEKIKASTDELSESLKGVWQGVGQSIQSTLSDALYNAEFSLRSLTHIFRRALADITSAIIQAKLGELIKTTILGDTRNNSSSGGFLSGLFGAFLGTAAGGGMKYGPTLVGEDGPELAMAGNSGMRVWNMRQMSGMGANAGTFAPSYNISITGAQNDEAMRAEMIAIMNRKSAEDFQEYTRLLNRNGVVRLR